MDCGGDTAYVFIAMIVLSDENGIIKHTAESLSRAICKDAESVRQALYNLERQDPSSNLKAHGGRRIVPLCEVNEDETRGWLVVNKAHYRDKKDLDVIRAQTRERVRSFRDRNAEKRDVTLVTQGNAKKRHTDTDTDTDTDTKDKDIVGQRPDASRLQKKSALEVLIFLNEKTGRNYEPVAANLDLIIARLKDGSTVEDCRAVVAKKCREWKGDEKMDEFLRPKTLFNRTNFAQYRGEIGTADPERKVAAS